MSGAEGIINQCGTSSRTSLIETVAVVCLLSFFCYLGLTSVRHQSVTVDELVYVTGGYSYWALGDYRLNPDSGHLPQRWATLTMLPAGYTFPAVDQAIWHKGDMWEVARQFFFGLSNDTHGMLWRSRVMIGMMGLALGLVVYFWSKSLFGIAGGMLSLALFALSPTLLAHGFLVTSDVTSALFFLTSLAMLWIIFHRVSPWTLAGSTLAVAGLFLSKMSAVLIVPMAGLLLILRLVMGRPLTIRLWRTWQVKRRAVILSCLLMLAMFHTAVSGAAIWASFGFEYSAFRVGQPVQGQFLQPWESVLEGTGRLKPAIRFARDQRLLPETYVYGFAYVIKHTKWRRAFLNGEYSGTGWPSFFPL